MMDIGFFDILLVFGVAVHVTVLAFISNPGLKAGLYALPIPFTLAVLALGEPVNTTHAIGLLFIFLFVHGVRILSNRFACPVVVAICMCATAYCILGWAAVQLLPLNGFVFFSICGGSAFCAVSLHALSPCRKELHYKTPLNPLFKFVIMLLLVTGLVAIKNYLQGVMVFFPMAGVIAAYESRFSLWTWSRHVPILVLGMSAVLVFCYSVQSVIGIGFALAGGWVIYLFIWFVLTMRMWGYAFSAKKGRSALMRIFQRSAHFLRWVRLFVYTDYVRLS